MTRAEHISRIAHLIAEGKAGIAADSEALRLLDSACRTVEATLFIAVNESPTHALIAIARVVILAEKLSEVAGEEAERAARTLLAERKAERN